MGENPVESTEVMTVNASAPMNDGPSPRTRAWRRDDRLLADAVRALEHDGQALINDPAAAEVGRHTGDDLESRIIGRADALPIAARLRTAVHELQRVFITIAVVALVAAGLAGAATMRAALGGSSDEPTNVFVVLGSILLLQTLLLFLWLAVLIVRPRTVATGSIGAVVLSIARWIGRRFRNDATHLAAGTALGRRWIVGPTGVWTLSSISHAAWLSFNIGALLAGILLLTTRHYTFAWQTTIFSDNPDTVYVPLTRALGWLPNEIGFEIPTDEQVRNSMWPGDIDTLADTRRPWSSLIIACIVLYGFAPRLLLTALCLGQRRSATNRSRIDLESPYAHRLRPLLMPESWHLGVVDPEERDEQQAAVPSHASIAPALGPLTGTPAIVGYELEQPGKVWPPSVHGVRWLDLGFVSSRDDRHRVYTQIRTNQPPPPLVVVVASLLTTPDRGVARFLVEVRKNGGRPVLLVLTSGQALRERSDARAVHLRLDDWHALGEDSGLDATSIAEIDLDHLTERSAKALATLLGATNQTTTAERRLERAFDIILEHAARWHAPPDHGQLVTLHTEIARLYRNEALAWNPSLDAIVRDPTTVMNNVRDAAKRMHDLLPIRLRTSPRWLGVGALAGALGCAAAATFVAPVAIASLPAWTGIGAAIAAVLPGIRRRDDDDATPGALTPADPAAVHSDAIHAAMVHAMVLELQGDGEDAITRTLDLVLPATEPPALPDVGSTRNYLDECRHRFDIARASGATES
jgi:hypothetical protein